MFRLIAVKRNLASHPALKDILNFSATKSYRFVGGISEISHHFLPVVAY
jgi:hypothetical protein